MMQVLFINKSGQVSTEILATLDILLRKVRNTKISISGLLVIDMLDNKHITPVEGEPTRTSTHILTSFKFATLQHSVRARGCPDLQQHRNIAQLHHRKYKYSHELIDEFKN